jgi:hypothetical protein
VHLGRESPNASDP